MTQRAPAKSGRPARTSASTATPRRRRRPDLPRLTFLCDENVPRKMAAILDLFDRDNDVQHLTDVWDRGIKDVDWIPRAAELKPRPVIVSGDGRILKNHVETAALKRSRLTFVYLLSGWVSMPWEERIPRMTRAWPHIVAAVRSQNTPAVLKVPARGGRVTRVQSLKTLPG